MLKQLKRIIQEHNLFQLLVMEMNNLKSKVVKGETVRVNWVLIHQEISLEGIKVKIRACNKNSTCQTTTNTTLNKQLIPKSSHASKLTTMTTFTTSHVKATNECIHHGQSKMLQSTQMCITFITLTTSPSIMVLVLQTRGVKEVKNSSATQQWWNFQRHLPKIFPSMLYPKTAPQYVATVKKIKL